MKIKVSTIFFCIIILIMFLRGMALINHFSLTADEGIMLANGYASLKTYDFKMGEAHPPLIKLLSAILFIKIKPNIYLREGWQKIDLWEYGSLFLFGSGNDADVLIRKGRIPILLLSLLLLLYIFKWSKELFGIKSAIIASVLYAFEPNIIAFSSIATNDLGVTIFIFISVYYLWKALETTKTRFWILNGIFTGLALTSKHSALILFPFYIGILIFNREKLEIKKIILGLLSLILIINLVYFFQGTFTPLNQYEFKSAIFRPLNNDLIDWIPFPLPYYYLDSVDKAIMLTGIGGKQKETYILGKFRTNTWYYFLIALIIKTTIPLLILILISSVAFFSKIKANRRKLLFLFGVPILFIIFFSLGSYKIGVRHLLPSYPFLIIIAGSYNKFMRVKPLLKTILILLIFWQIIASVVAYPNYIAYFNEFVGSADNGHKYLIDSNIDWGQDLKTLKEWQEKNRINEIYLSYFGHDNPKYRKINYKIPPCYNITKGWIAISVNHLYKNIFTGQPKDCYSHMLKYAPDAKAGYSIFLYNLS